MKSNDFPFKILALSSFTLKGAPSHIKRPIPVTPETLDDVIKKLELTTIYHPDKHLCPKGEISLSLERFRDFHPDRIIRKNEYLKQFLELKSIAKKTRSNQSELRSAFPNLPPLPCTKERSNEKPTQSDKIDSILSMVAFEGGSVQAPTLPVKGIDAWIDETLSGILDMIFSDEDFKQVESSWRGLYSLLKLLSTEIERDVIIEILPVEKSRLSETLTDLIDDLLDDAPSLILVDIPITHPLGDEKILKAMAHMADTLLTPTLTFLTHQFFNLESWDGIGKLPFLSHYFDESSYSKWRHIKKDASAHWIAVTLNRYMIRFPYGKNNPVGLSTFMERSPLWISPVWGITHIILQSLIKTGSFSSITRRELADLGIHETASGRHSATEFLFSNDRLDQLLRCGIMPLHGKKNRDSAFIPQGITLSGEPFSYQLFLSRLTHYLIHIKAKTPMDLSPFEIKQILHTALEKLWEYTGQMLPEGFRIDIGDKTADGKFLVRLLFFPKKQSSQQNMNYDMEFLW